MDKRIRTVAVVGGQTGAALGVVSIGVRAIDVVSRWQTVLNMRPYVSFLVDPWFGILVLGASVYFLHWLENNHSKFQEEVEKVTIYDAAGKPTASRVPVQPAKSTKSILLRAIVIGMAIAMLATYIAYEWLPVRGTTLGVMLQPSEGPNQKESTPPFGAYIRVENHSDETDHSVYVRLQAPAITSVTVENPDRMKILGSFPPRGAY